MRTMMSRRNHEAWRCRPGSFSPSSGLRGKKRPAIIKTSLTLEEKEEAAVELASVRSVTF